MQKKMIWRVVLSVLLVVALSGCGGTAPSQEDIYIDMAQEFIAQEDYAAAIDILQKGAEAVQSEKISRLLQELGTKTGEPVDWASFVGTWSEEGIGWEYGGMVLDVHLWEGEGEEGMWVDLCLNLVQGAPGSRCAEIYGGAVLEEMTWPVYTSNFEDSWGNTGKFTLTFGEDSIRCVIDEEMEYDPGANWGMYPGTYTLVRNDKAWDDLNYDENEYNELYGDEYYEDEYLQGEPEGGMVNYPTGGAWIEKGGIRYDDIGNSLVVSMEQIKKDLKEQKDFNSEYELVDILPIVGEYVDRERMDSYRVTLLAYVSKDQKIYEARFQIFYNYNDIGGWKYQGNFFFSSTAKEFDTEMFGVSGKKVSDFSYTDYPMGTPISLGEIADDILYGKHNILEVYNEPIAFDIKSLNVIKGNYSDSGQYLTLIVEALLTCDLYDAEVKYELDYYNYTAGGWELHHTGNMTERKKYTAKVATYNDEAFLAFTPPYLDEVTRVGTNEFKNENGELTQRIDYVAKRKRGYIVETYDLAMEATFKSNGTWTEKMEVDFIDTDYSKLIGVWEAEHDGDTFRITITDAKMDAATDTGTISYLVETSLASECYQGTEELDIQKGYIPYRENYAVYCHDLAMASVIAKLNEDTRIDFTVHRDKGVVIDYVEAGYHTERNEIVLEKTR